MVKPLHELTDEEIERAAQTSRAARRVLDELDRSDRTFRAFDAIVGAESISPNVDDVRRVLHAAEAAGVADDDMRARAAALIETLSTPRQDAAELAHETRLLREAMEQAAREAASRDAREQAHPGMRRIVETTRANAANLAGGAQLPRPPKQRQEAHEESILYELRQRGFDPLRLPPAPSGKRSPAKQAAREALPRIPRAAFDKAWLRLRAAGKIADA